MVIPQGRESHVFTVNIKRLFKSSSATFVTSAFSQNQYPDTTFPEVAFAGRSNVGKSSLINSLLNRKKLVKVSSTPGKTQSVNFFLINEKAMLVDLPGYGFAKAPKSVKAVWSKVLEDYILNRGQLRAVVLLIDIRHEPSRLDRQMKAWLDYHGVLTKLVATKSDKISSKSALIKRLDIIRKTLNLVPEEGVISYSSRHHTGRDLLWEYLEGVYQTPQDNICQE